MSTLSGPPALIDGSRLAARDEPVWLHCGAMIDGTGKSVRRDAHVVYDRHAIRFVGCGRDMPPPHVLKPDQVAPDVVAHDQVLLPGLCDAHTHLFLDGAELDVERRAAHLMLSQDELMPGARARLAGVLADGVTAVRDAGDRRGVGLALSAEGRASHNAGVAYIDSPGAGIHRQGRYGSFMGEAFDSPEASVAARVEQGADRIKIIATGVVDFEKDAVTSAPQFTGDEIRRMVSAARAAGRQTFAHASGDAGIDHCIEGGVDSIEHGYFVRDDQLARMRDANIAWVPTFAPVQAQLTHADRLGWNAFTQDNIRRVLARHAESLQKAYHLGVRILAGSDSGSYGVDHGSGLRTELALMEDTGLPTLTVWNAATGRSAAHLGLRDIGRISAGCRSRFLLAPASIQQATRNLGGALLVCDDAVIRVR